MKRITDYETTTGRLNQALDYLDQNTDVVVEYQGVRAQKPLPTNIYKLTVGQHSLGYYTSKEFLSLATEIKNRAYNSE